MPVPDFQSITLPVLQLAALSDVHTRDAIETLASQFELTKDEREELLPSGNQTRFANRVYWAVVYLQKAGLIERRARGVYSITDAGRQILIAPPPRLDRQFLSQFDSMRDFQERKSKDNVDLSNSDAPSLETPEERIETAIDELNEALRLSLLDRVRSMTPAGFEKLIVDLMLGMNYGADGSGRHLGRTADGGIDGIINEDILGLDVIYPQAKRYAEGNNIGVEKVREFAGALDERGATKGVFVTTSQFAGPARQYAERSHKRLILIDGNQLTEYLVKHGVAVRTYQTLELKKLDAEYFEGMDI